MFADRIKTIPRHIVSLLTPVGPGKWRLAAIGILTFFMGGLFSPIIGQWGARLGELLGPPPRDVLIAACSPLQEARIVLRHELNGKSEIVADKRVDFMNETQILFKNDMKEKLTNVTLLVYPIFASGESDKTLFTIMYAGALIASSSYVVDRKADAYIVKASVIHAGEYVHIQNHLSQPASYIIELTSDQLTRKAAFAPGCLRGFPEKVKITVPIPFYKHIGDTCKDQGNNKPIECTGSNKIDFDLTENLRWEKLTAEYVVIKFGRRE